MNAHDPTEVIVGIDLGTTNSLVAWQDQRGPRVLPDAEGRPILPSVVRLVVDGPPIVGHPARAHAVEHPEDTIASVKRLMGRDFAELQELAARLPFTLVEGARGMVCVAAHGRSYAPEELSAMILSTLRRQAEAALGRPVRKAVVTVPAYFDDGQRQATRDAGRLAGIEVVRILNEPTAAALAYGIGQRVRQPETIVVYDLGGGTFDVSVLNVVPSPTKDADAAGARDDKSGFEDAGDLFQVLATAGDTSLGGDDLDRLLMERIEASIAEQLGGAVSLTPSVRQTLRLAAERTKIALSDAESVPVAIDLGDGRRFDLSIDRAELEAMAAPLVERTLACCRRALADAGIAADAVDRIVLVGGMTRMPAVREAVGRFFGRVPYSALDPEQVVAMGAAVQAAVLAGGRRDLLLLDVIPLSLGIETVGGAVAKLIMRNSAVPARAVEMFSTSVDGQVNVMIHVLQGERELVADCRSLGRFDLRGIPPMPAGVPQIEVEFVVDANGILDVSAVERRSGRRAAIQVAPSHGLAREEVDRMERESFAHARDDMRIHRVIDLVVNASLDIKWIGDALRRVRSELEPEYAADLDERIASLRSAVEAARRDPASANADVLAQAKQALDVASVRLHEIAIARSLREMPAR